MVNKFHQCIQRIYGIFKGLIDDIDRKGQEFHVCVQHYLVMIVWQLIIQLPVQSVPIST